MAEIVPIMAMAIPLNAPSIAPNSMARAVPTPWAAEPSATPRACGSFIPVWSNIQLPIRLPNMPTRNTTTDVIEVIPPKGSEIEIAIGTVTDFGAIDTSISWFAPIAAAIPITLPTPTMQPVKIDVKIATALPLICSLCSYMR